MIKTGVIGLGKMGMSHYATLNAHPDVKIVAAADTNGWILSTLKKLVGVDTYKDYREMIRSAGLDCVLVSTPTDSHAEVVAAALEGGLHVFVEKPFCLDPEDGRRLARISREKKLVGQVGYHYRFIRTFQEAKRLLDLGLLGRVHHIGGEAYGQVVIREEGFTWRTNKAAGGGCLHDYCSHVIDLMNYLVGPPRAVLGATLNRIFSKSTEDAVYATLSYGDGSSGQIAANWSDDSYRKMSTRITVQGTNGKIVADRQELHLYLMEAPASGEFRQGWNVLYITDLQKPVSFYIRGEEYTAQIDHFIGSIRSGSAEGINRFESALQTDLVIREISDVGKSH